MRACRSVGTGIPKAVPRLMHPKTRLGISVLHGVLDLASRPTVQAIAARMTKSKAKAAPLPDFGAAIG